MSKVLLQLFFGVFTIFPGCGNAISQASQMKQKVQHNKSVRELPPYLEVAESGPKKVIVLTINEEIITWNFITKQKQKGHLSLDDL